jgi:hypothetical protein
MALAGQLGEAAPDDLPGAVKQRWLPASELLQEAVRAELRRQELLDETEVYLEELVAEVGEPSEDAVARAEELSRSVQCRDNARRAS